jgi:hypothetical protein
VNSCRIAIPTAGTVGAVVAARTFPEALLYVPAQERQEYELFYGAERVLGVKVDDRANPKDLLLAGLANAALADAGRDKLLLVGHDVYGIGYWEAQTWVMLDPAQLAAFIANGFRLAAEAGAVLWGVNPSRGKRDYQVFRPFSLLLPPPWGWTGHLLPHRLRYDARTCPFQDTDLGLQALCVQRRVWRLEKYHVLRSGDTSKAAGHPQAELEAGQRAADMLRRKWGRRVIKEYDAERMDLELHVPIPGC